MNKTNTNKIVRYILYGVIVAICIISIFVGIYTMQLKISSSVNTTENNATNENETAENVSAEEQDVNDFKSLFKNNFLNSNYDSSRIKKLKADNEIVYSFANFKDKKEAYDIDINIPIINIDNEVVAKYNKNTQIIFADKVNNIRKSVNTGEQTICTISYTSCINNNILSVAIMENLKEGRLPQRLIVQTYNYNLDTGREVTINDILTSRGVDSTSINKRIHSTIKTLADDDSTIIAETGYNVYKRDINSDIYDVKNVKSFIQGPNGELYIIYAYGNTANTSELDVIKI